MNQRLTLQQQQSLMQQVMLHQQHQQLYHSEVLAAAMSQMEPIPSGNLPPGFDPSTCRSVYVGNIHPNVTESLLEEVFQSIGPLEGCKLIRKEKSSFGFVDYHDRRSAALAIMSLHGLQIYGQAIKVNWAFASGQREDTSGHFHIFVGDLSPEVTDATLFACFSVYVTCSDARVMWDNKTGRSRGFGFVSFRNQQDAQKSIDDMTGKWLGSRQIRCNWAAKTPTGEEKPQNDDQNQIAVVLTEGSSNTEGAQESSNEMDPDNNPAYTTVYVGNLAHENIPVVACLRRPADQRLELLLSEGRSRNRKVPQVSTNQVPQILVFFFSDSGTNPLLSGAATLWNEPTFCLCLDAHSLRFSFSSTWTQPQHSPTHQVTQTELHRQFHILGAGVIEEVRIQRDKGFGFVRYHSHDEAALAIQMANGRLVCGKSMKCSWGTKPTPPGTTSNPLPPPVPPFQLVPMPDLQGFKSAELLAYQRQLALNQAAAGAMVGQYDLAAAQALAGFGGSQAIYDAYSNLLSGQQLVYYN